MMKVSPWVGWLIGLAAGLLAFFVIGVQILFSVSYSMMHNGSGDMAISLVVLGTFAAVLVACLWIAGAIKKAISR